MISYTGFSREKALLKGKPRRVYGTLGDGELQRRVARSLTEWFLPEDARDFNFEALDGESSSVSQVLASAYSLPFLSDFRVVHVSRAEKLDGLDKSRESEASGTKSKGKSSPAKALSEGIKSLPASTVLIFSRTPETPEAGARAATPRCVHATVDKAIEEKGLDGQIIDCTLGVKNKGQAIALLESESRARGIAFERGAVAYLVERAGTDIMQLESEMEKCALRAGGAPITRAVIDDMVQKTLQESVFDLTDALGEKKSARAITLARELLGSGTAPEPILALMTRHFRQLLQARALLDLGLALDGSAAGRLSASQASQFPQDAKDNLPGLMTANWSGAKLADRMRGQARSFSVEQLTRALALCLEADMALKGIENDEGAAVSRDEALIFDLLITKLT